MKRRSLYEGLSDELKATISGKATGGPKLGAGPWRREGIRRILNACIYTLPTTLPACKIRWGAKWANLLRNDQRDPN
ncbi:MAG: hypothetical protein MZU97_27270 [Bacillus subtilis]|nr:hypothetical protein [Bacillus subtilis]